VDRTATRQKTRSGHAVRRLARADTPVTHEFRASLIDGMPPLPATIAARAECLRVEGAPLPSGFACTAPPFFPRRNLKPC